jgi:hypothetical protein
MLSIVIPRSVSGLYRIEVINKGTAESVRAFLSNAHVIRD